MNFFKDLQNWFSSTERSSGFRPYLIFLIILVGFALISFTFFRDIEGLIALVFSALKISGAAFIFLFAIKSFQDPSFCRSEKHIQNIRKMELMEQKGDLAPKPIQTGKVEIISNPQISQLPHHNEDGVQK